MYCIPTFNPITIQTLALHNPTQFLICIPSLHIITLHGLSVDVMHLRYYVVLVHEEGEGAEGVEGVRVGAQVP